MKKLKLKLNSLEVRSLVQEHTPQIKELVLKHDFEFVLKAFLNCLHYDTTKSQSSVDSDTIETRDIKLKFIPAGLFDSKPSAGMAALEKPKKITMTLSFHVAQDKDDEGIILKSAVDPESLSVQSELVVLYR